MSYEEEFSEFIRLCETTKPGDLVIVAMPEALGDDYCEIIESLNRLSAAAAHLAIARPKDRAAAADFVRRN